MENTTIANIEPVDATGRNIKMGDRVRIIGIPNLAGMAPEQRKRSQPVYEYLVGKYKRVKGFDEKGLVWLQFTIRKGPEKGLHCVGIEPYLLRLGKDKDKDKDKE